MGKVITIDVEFSDALSEHVAELTGAYGLYDNVGDYVRALITRDQELVERQRFEALKTELTRAFAASPDSFHPSTPEDVFARNRR
jgi:Arc/MetJ-type ribon-helix-helix transcriptional regulator